VLPAYEAVLGAVVPFCLLKPPHSSSW